MLFFLVVLTGFVTQLLLGVLLVVFDVQQLTILPLIVVAVWYARRGDPFAAYAASFILALTAALLGGGTRGIGLLAAFGGTTFAVVTWGIFRGPGWLSRMLHVVLSVVVYLATAALLFPLFGVGAGFGAILVRVGLLCAVLTGLASFPMHAFLSRLDPLLQAGASGRRLVD